MTDALIWIAGCITIGVLLRLSNRLGPSRFAGGDAAQDVAHALNAYVIHVALPALILVQVRQAAFQPDMIVPALLPWLLLGAMALLVHHVGQWARWPRPVIGALMLLVPLGNTSFLGFPLIQAFWGDAGLPYAIVYDQFGSFLALCTYGVWVQQYYGEGAAIDRRQLWRRLLQFTPFPALLIALLLHGIVLPAAIESLLVRLGQSLVPVILVAVGLQWQLSLPRGAATPLAFGLSLKLLAMPFLAFALVTLLGFDGPVAQISVFEAGMAPMITAGALAMNANLAPRLAAAMVGFGIPISVLTLSIWQLILR